jgi:hypothetical protein
MIYSVAMVAVVAVVAEACVENARVGAEETRLQRHCFSCGSVGVGSWMRGRVVDGLRICVSKEGSPSLPYNLIETCVHRFDVL